MIVDIGVIWGWYRFKQEPDETLGERLWGLTEMFPERVRNVCGTATDLSISTTKALYSFSCSASWIFFTSSMILFAPVLCEVEIAQMEELQRSQQKQVIMQLNFFFRWWQRLTIRVILISLAGFTWTRFGYLGKRWTKYASIASIISKRTYLLHILLHKKK